MNRVPSRTASARRMAVASVVAAGALAAPLAPWAAAHDSVVGGSPADGDVVSEFPDELTLTFSGQIQEGFNTLALSNADTEEVLHTGEPVLDGHNVTLELPDDLPEEPGNYKIGFQIISSDGHAAKGMTTFTYQPDATAAAAAAPAAEETEEEEAAGSRNMRLLVASLGVLAIAGAAIAVLAKRRKQQDSGDEFEG
ncbi:copper resistance CopC family protein [Corynebacterium auris]|uniref:copper resistance CopC family protein n=1 Tax=Corynebacterium auris TaxID=44750 RepID=UPI0025B2B97A|nr:copper resistance CopC family protein [Corynebacterium auris]WJY68192.1 hypothetical protein CAURIS_06450 [Corynebacterium auris]